MQRFVKSSNPAPSFGGGSDYEMKIGGLPKFAEILAFVMLIAVTGKSSAASFITAEPDLDAVVANLITNVRCSYNGEQDNVLVQPDELRDYCVYQNGDDPYTSYPAGTGLIGGTVGAAIPISSGTAGVLTIPVVLPFTSIQKENPNVNVPSGYQLNENAHFNMQGNGAGTANLVLTNGTFAQTAVSMKLCALLGRRRVVNGELCAWVAPTLILKRRNMANNPDTETGPLLDELMFETRDAPTLTAITGTISQLEVDSENQVAGNQTPTDLAAAFLAETISTGGRAGGSYDITRNTKHAGIAGRSPFVWINGKERADESEVPFVASYRTIAFTSPPNGTVIYARWLSIKASSTQTMIQQLQPGTAAQGLSFDKLAIKGGGSSGPGSMNSSLSDFKPRWLCPAKAA